MFNCKEEQCSTNPMDQIQCPWASYGQLPAHYCEPNACAWIVQPINTWSNIGYLIVAFLILREKNWNSNKYWFSFLAAFLFFGSSFYHMTGTYIGHEFDLAAMLLLSSYCLSLSCGRLLKWKTPAQLGIFAFAFITSAITIDKFYGGDFFVGHLVIMFAMEFLYIRHKKLPANLKKTLGLALGIFIFALGLNLLDMTHTYCLPENNFLTLHAIWHLLCAWCIYLGVRYFCVDYSEMPT